MDSTIYHIGRRTAGYMKRDAISLRANLWPTVAPRTLAGSQWALAPRGGEPFMW